MSYAYRISGIISKWDFLLTSQSEKPKSTFAKITNTRNSLVWSKFCAFNRKYFTCLFQNLSYFIFILGQLDPWKQVKKIVKTGRVDTLLHVGDQIYPNDENMAHAEKIFSGIYDEMPEDKQHEMMLRAHELWRQLYTINFNTKYKKEVLSNTSNVMIWSDNDVANDFTTLKNESGDQAYHPKFLVCGMEAYKVRMLLLFV